MFQLSAPTGYRTLVIVMIIYNANHSANVSYHYLISNYYKCTLSNRMMSLTDGSKPTLSLKIRRKFEGVNGHFQLKNSQKTQFFPNWTKWKLLIIFFPIRTKELDEVETIPHFWFSCEKLTR